MTRVPSVPLITHDPYFSLWSPADKLYETQTVHWTGIEKTTAGIINVDGKEYRFLGTAGPDAVMEQVSLSVTPTSTSYMFCAGGVELTVRFTSPFESRSIIGGYMHLRSPVSS